MLDNINLPMLWEAFWLLVAALLGGGGIAIHNRLSKDKHDK